ncbi:MAG: YciI family protein, partial [Myxococcota bacterium]
MRYLLLIYSSEADYPEPSNEKEFEDMLKPWYEYDAMLKEQKAFLAGDALMPTETATTVAVRDGKPVFTDGPFAETKEQLG